MIRQLSIFAENKRGTMNEITKVLTEAQINMNTLVTNDSAELGLSACWYRIRTKRSTV